MQVTETKNAGLKREFKVRVEAKTISEQLDTQLKGMSGRVKIPGFRPGHIPMNVLRQRFGKNVFGEVIERTINQSSQRVLKDRSLRAALPPKIEIITGKEGEDLEFKMETEILPEVPEVDYASISLEKPVCTVEDKEVEEALNRLAERNKTYKTAEKSAKAKKGSQVIIDFVGKKDGVAFEGGSAKDFALVLGSGQFIPGFEDQLIGTKAGSEVEVKVSFPKEYHKEDLAGQPATFDVTVHEVREGEKTEVNEEFAKTLGFKDIESLRKAIHDQIKGEYDSLSRAKLKKQLFDHLEEKMNFPIPQGMVEMEFNSIWEKLQMAKKEGDETLLSKSDDELKAEYSKIAERRVKLGILLSDVALKNKLQINQDELSRAVMQQASQFPGQERRIFEFYQKNPNHLEELRGPILEEKAVDFIIGKSKVADKAVTAEELASEDEAASSQEAAKKKPAAKAKKKAANE